MAQHKALAIDTHLGIGLYAFPAIAIIDRSIVIVACDKVFAAMQRLDQGRHALLPLANGEVTQVLDLIIRSNH
jgi:hypothetical protein